MEKRKDKKTLIIISLVLSIISIAIGYASLAQNLNIIGTADISKAEWDVKITSIVLNSEDSVGITEAPDTPTLENAAGQTSTIEGTTARFSVDLAYPGAKAIYTVTVTNNGTIAAKLKSITDLTSKNAEDPAQIKFTITGPAPNTTVNASGTQVFTVTAEWVASNNAEVPDEIPEATSKTATITLNYEQA